MWPGRDSCSSQMYVGLASAGPSLPHWPHSPSSLLTPRDYPFFLSASNFILNILSVEFCTRFWRPISHQGSSSALIMLLEPTHHCMLRAARKQETEMNTQLSLEVGVGGGRFSKALGNDWRDFNRGVTGSFCAFKRSLWWQCGGRIWNRVWGKLKAEESLRRLHQ